ncbi:MAG: glyoxalase [Maricaulis sp.]|jgi:catechol 2,3-dioxygenase-like lactoylglutathione lyase family enzyme|nr:glyoxalase [Maricaulis sp.]HAQ35265.1 glyoxalase [Alphaproteobacteria bacterium]|tara:strand:- start:822 stop:1196 length:375 start_codon:yes stop_codon:yes gene_type:complete
MRLNQITLPVRDIARSKAFYLTLGFRLLVDSAHYCRFLAPEGDTTFSIHAEDGEIATGAVLYLENGDMDADFKRLNAAGVAFETDPADESWLWREARFRDPDGHVWKLYFAGENRVNPPWRVKG